MSFFGNNKLDSKQREGLLGMASILSGMSTNPNVALQDMASQGIADIQKTRATTASSDKLAKEAEQALKLIGTTYPDIAQAIQGGFMSPKEGMQEVMRRRNEPANESFITITGENATAKGLDPSRSYNVSSTTGKITGIGAGGTTIINEAGAPDQDELYKVLAKNEAEQWGGLLKAGSTAATIIPDLNALGELLNQAPNGPIQGRLAQTFSGFSTPADAAKALISRMAPSMRVEGSGSSSDIDVKMLMDSLGSLINDPSANALIHQAFKAKLNLDVQRQSIVRKVQSKTFTVNEGRAELEKLDQVSILPSELRGMISTNAASSIQAGGIPAGISKKKWESLTQAQKDSISGLFTQ